MIKNVEIGAKLAVGVIGLVLAGTGAFYGTKKVKNQNPNVVKARTNRRKGDDLIVCDIDFVEVEA